MSSKLGSWYMAERTDWRTPQDFFDLLHKEFQFTVDAAATPENAMLPRYWTKADDALTQDWSGERVWCNPPYGAEARPFIEKAAMYEAEIAVLLVPARPDTAVWQEVIFPMAREIRFVRGRLRFEGAPHSAPFPSAVLVFGYGETFEVPEEDQPPRGRWTRTVPL